MASNYLDLSQEFNTIEGNYSKSLQELKDIVSSIDCNIQNKVQFLKEQVVIRIETLKTELDIIENEFNSKLDAINCDLLKKKDEYMQNGKDLLTFESELQRLKDDNKNKESLSLHKMMNYERKLKQLTDLIDKLRDIGSEQIVHMSTEMIKPSTIGAFLYEQSLDEISVILNQQNFEEIELQDKVRSICTLSNGTLLMVNNKGIVLYDKKLNIIKMVDTAGEVACGISNNFDKIFLLHDKIEKIVVYDLDLNEIRLNLSLDTKPVALARPRDICYYNGSLFICESAKIKRITENFVFENDYGVDYDPWRIRILQNIAFVMGGSNGTERLIIPCCYFYHIDGFRLINKVRNESFCVIGTIGVNFYQHYTSKKEILFYNHNGELLQRLDVSRLYTDAKATYTIHLTYFNKFLVIGSSSTNTENKMITFGKRD